MKYVYPTIVSVVDGGGETPGPIPNPEAKPARADGTAPGRGWESKLPPTQQLKTKQSSRTPPTTGNKPPTKGNNPVVGGCVLLLPTTHGLPDWFLQLTPPPQSRAAFDPADPARL